MRRLLSAVLFVLCSFVFAACGGGGEGGGTHKVTVYGTILDSAGRPVAGATVTVHSDPVTTTTDSDGNFSLEAPPGIHTITAVKGGDTFLNSGLTVVPGIDNNLGELSPSVTYWRDGVQPTVEAPAITPSAGSYATSQSVAISTATEGASIRYTTDGTAPTSETGTPYTGAFDLSASSTVKAIAFRENWLASPVSAAAYDLTVAPPTFSPESGVFTSGYYERITIVSATPGATIRYTTDGSDPTESHGTVYDGWCFIGSSRTLKAVAYKTGWATSRTSTASYRLAVAEPSFSLATGTYASWQPVTLASSTFGATIRYTTDGSTPTESHGSLYNAGFAVTSPMTLKAVAYKTGWETSQVSSAAYNVMETVAAPTFEPAAGTYTTAQSVTIASATSGATIRYTTDGSTPTESHGTPYAGAISVNSSQTLKAVAYKPDWLASSASAAYNVTGTVAAPGFGPEAGTYPAGQSVTITCATDGASIRYTTDGSIPTESYGTVYAGAIAANSSQTLKAVAYKTGWETSSVATADYEITGTVAAPTFSPAAGTYVTGQSVAIAAITGGATVRYTTDGSTPTESYGTVYAGEIPVNSSQTLKALAYRTGWATSSVSAAAYNIVEMVAPPTFGPVAGTYSTWQLVTLTCAIEDATIRYTTDGSIPSESHGMVYTVPITAYHSQTIKAVAYTADRATSTVSTANYKITGTVAQPVFGLASGTYTTEESVTITSATSGATIRYTTDGSIPTESYGIIYAGAIAVSSSQTLNAVACKTDWATSSVSTAVYNITGTVESPTFSPAAGTYSTGQTVTITSATEGATIRYTTDGSIPTDSYGTLYTGPILVSSSQTIKARAYKPGWRVNSISGAGYTITGTVEAPTLSLAAGTYTSSQPLIITSATSGATIRYTTDGSTPTETNGTVYSGTIAVNSSQTLRAVAYKTNWITSPVTAADYNITGRVAVPTISPAEGIYTAGQSVTITSSTDGATIRYTTDGSFPTESHGTVYTGSIAVNSSQTIRARAYKTDWATSLPKLAAYKITGTVAPPMFGPAAGTYATAQSATITCATDGATIRYTADGADPTENHGTLYTGPIPLSSSQTLKAVAYKTDWATSSVTTSVYDIGGTVAAPIFGTVAGPYTTGQLVTITSTTDGASIRYTSDGSIPTENYGTVYSGAIAVSSPQTIKAVAYKTDWETSSVSSAAYNITGTVAAPSFGPASGTYATGQTVTITSSTDGATIRYTIDGSIPTETHGTVYTGSIAVNSSRTIKARAYRTDWITSPVSVADYIIEGTVAAPMFSPTEGTFFTSPLSITITSATSGATIRYTTNGHIPDENYGTVYTGPVTMYIPQTLKAVAYKTGLATSPLSSADYNITGTVAAPGFWPPSGIYTSTQSVGISCSTFGTTIRYTTDGSTPTETHGTIYSTFVPWQGTVSYGPITVSSSQTLRAVAYRADWVTSSATIGDYNITGAIDAPTFSPAAGTYPAGQTITITSSSNGATIRYTTDGSTPTESNGTLYTGAITLTSPQTLKAVAYKADWATSSVATAAYNIEGTVAAPAFSLAAGTYTSSRSVTIDCATSGATIRYTTDGSTPTESAGTVYAGALTVTSPQTLKAVAYKAGFTTSPVATITYNITGTVATPTFDAPAGTYTTGQWVTIGSATPGATIRYTIDTGIPTVTSGIVYTGPIWVSSSKTLKAVAYKTDWVTSSSSMAVYNITGTVAAPTFSQAAGVYISAFPVYITTSTGGAIRYTTDGSDPSETYGTLYSGGVWISSSQTIKAVAYRTDWVTSSVSTAVYNITGTVAAPTFSPEAGTYDTWKSVAITTSTPGATIRYTTDGSIPTESYGTPYSGPIFVSSFLTLRAVAYKADWAKSTVSLATYRIGSSGVPAWTIISSKAIDEAGSVAIDGGMAYVSAGYRGIHILDLADPLNPAEVGQIPADRPSNGVGFGYIPYSVSAANGTLFAKVYETCSGWCSIVAPTYYQAPIFVYDVSVPSAPVALPRIWWLNPYYWVLDGDILYCTTSHPDAEPEFNILDVSDAANPILLGTTAIESPGSLALDDGIAWITHPTQEGMGGLQPVDVTVGWDPVKIGPVQEGIYENATTLGSSLVPPFAVANGWGYIGTGLFLGYYTFGGVDYDTIEIADLSDPENVTIVDSMEMPSFFGLQVKGRYLYVKASKEILIFDVSMPRYPEHVLSIDTDTEIYGLTLGENFGVIRAASGQGHPVMLHFFTLPAE